MKYQVEYTSQAIKELKKLDGFTKRMIKAWIDKNLVDCENPRLHGKALSANRSGQWRYRIGDYRILADIQNEKIVILVFSVGQRSNGCSHLDRVFLDSQKSVSKV